MRRIVFIGLIALTVGLISVPVRAADLSPELTDAQADQIRQNCKQVQSVLQRLQSTDVATRVIRGRIYENLLNRLMTPFNNRVGLNRYDASSLSLATTTTNQKFTDFKNDYVTYADAFSKLLSIKCEADPRGFYTLLIDARTARTKVADDITNLNTALDSYTTAFGSLRSSIEGR